MGGWKTWTKNTRQIKKVTPRNKSKQVCRTGVALCVEEPFGRNWRTSGVPCFLIGVRVDAEFVRKIGLSFPRCVDNDREKVVLEGGVEEGNSTKTKELER